MYLELVVVLEVEEVTAELGVLWLLLLFLASLLLFTLLVTISQLLTLLLSSLLFPVVQVDDDVEIVGKAVRVLDASPAPPAMLDAGASLNGDELHTGDPPTLSSATFATELEGVPQSGPGNE